MKGRLPAATRPGLAFLRRLARLTAAIPSNGHGDEPGPERSDGRDFGLSCTVVFGCATDRGQAIVAEENCFLRAGFCRTPGPQGGGTLCRGPRLRHRRRAYR